MRTNRSIKNDGIITFVVKDCYGRKLTDSYDMARSMTAGDFFDLLAACGGDFSLLQSNTREAMVIKSKELNDSRKERVANQALYRKKRAERQHNELIAEIRELMKGKDSFTALDVQLAAVQRGNGFPVRTRQMYAAHLRRGTAEDVIIKNYIDTSRCINVILRDGRMSHQRIPGTKNCVYKFIK